MNRQPGPAGCKLNHLFHWTCIQNNKLTHSTTDRQSNHKIKKCPWGPISTRQSCLCCLRVSPSWPRRDQRTPSSSWLTTLSKTQKKTSSQAPRINRSQRTSSATRRSRQARQWAASQISHHPRAVRLALISDEGENFSFNNDVNFQC